MRGGQDREEGRKGAVMGGKRLKFGKEEGEGDVIIRKEENGKHWVTISGREKE